MAWWGNLWDRLRGRVPEPDAFAQVVLDAMAARGGRARAGMVYRAEDFSLRSPNGGRDVVFLGNLYEDYRRAPRGTRAEVLERFIRVHHDAERAWSFDDALPQLLPRVRPRSFYGDMALRARLEGWEAQEHSSLPLAGFLAVGLVVDQPESVVELQSNRLREWNVEPTWLHDAARRNLARLTDGPFAEPMPGVFVSPWRDNHDASRLVLTEVIRRLGVRGRHVAFIPNRDTLIITGDADEAGLRAALAATEKELDVSRPLTGRALVLEGDTWAPLRLAPDHPLLDAVEEGRVRQELDDHGSQKALLDALHEKEGRNVFVASLTGIKRKADGRVSTYCVWSRDTVTLLPQADRVVLMDGGPDPVADVPWSVAVSQLGALMALQEGLYPPRWKVESFPDADQLAALKAPPGA